MIDSRIKIVRVDSQDVLEWFTFAVSGWPPVVSLPQFTGLPAGVLVLHVRENFYLRQFEFVIHHESFAEVPAGTVPPVFDAVEWQVVRVPRDATPVTAHSGGSNTGGE